MKNTVRQLRLTFFMGGFLSLLFSLSPLPALADDFTDYIRTIVINEPGRLLSGTTASVEDFQSLTKTLIQKNVLEQEDYAQINGGKLTKVHKYERLKRLFERGILKQQVSAIYEEMQSSGSPGLKTLAGNITNGYQKYLQELSTHPSAPAFSEPQHHPLSIARDSGLIQNPHYSLAQQQIAIQRHQEAQQVVALRTVSAVSTVQDLTYLHIQLEGTSTYFTHTMGETTNWGLIALAWLSIGQNPQVIYTLFEQPTHESKRSYLNQVIGDNKETAVNLFVKLYELTHYSSQNPGYDSNSLHLMQALLTEINSVSHEVLMTTATTQFPTPSDYSDMNCVIANFLTKNAADFREATFTDLQKLERDVGLILPVDRRPTLQVFIESIANNTHLPMKERQAKLAYLITLISLAQEKVNISHHQNSIAGLADTLAAVQLQAGQDIIDEAALKKRIVASLQQRATPREKMCVLLHTSGYINPRCAAMPKYAYKGIPILTQSSHHSPPTTLHLQPPKITEELVDYLTSSAAKIEPDDLFHLGEKRTGLPYSSLQSTCINMNTKHGDDKRFIKNVLKTMRKKMESEEKFRDEMISFLKSRTWEPRNKYDHILQTLER